jgi:hypothetical protein
MSKINTSTMKSLFMYVFAFALAWVLHNTKSCTGPTISTPDPVTEIVYRYIPEYHTIEKVVLRNVVIRDTVLSREFILKDTTIILFSDGDTIIRYPDDMRIYEGFSESDKCKHNYLTGIWHDSIQFLNIKTECIQEEPVVIVRPGGPPKFEWGITAAWSPMEPKSFPGLGLHARRRLWYFGTEYFPTTGMAIIRAGLFLPNKQPR